MKSVDFAISKNARYDIKNIGYLFAINNGAELIYDCESLPNFELDSYFSYDLTDYGLIYDCNVSSRIINPFAHFGQPLLNQRGNLFNQEVHINSYYVGKRKPSAIQHAIFNGWPDLSNRDEIEVNTPVKFDNTAPNFQLPIGKMAPFNSHQTLFKRQAFWALYLPSTVSYSDIFRSYWSQRLMRLINETVSFTGPKEIYLKTNSYKIDLDIERKLNELVEFLYTWKCLKLKFYECIIDLSIEMANNSYWSNKEVELIKDWLNDLNQIGYKEPSIVNFEHNSTNVIEENCKIYADKNIYSKVRFTPILQKTKSVLMSFGNNSVETTINKLETFLALNEFCELSGYTLKNLSKYLKTPYSHKAKYTLLITFNLIVFEKNIPILFHLYQSYFRNIVFCGLNIIDVLNETRGLNQEFFDSFTFIELNTHNGYFHYYCMKKAIEMNYETEGIFLASDDVLLKFWNLHNLDSTKIWFPQPLLPTIELKQNGITGWVWWRGNYPRLIKLFKFLNDSGQNNQLSPKEKLMVKEYLSTLDSHRVNNSYVLIGGSDMFYLPRNKFEKYHFISYIFRTHEVFLEIAVPTILLGLDSKNDSQIINGIYRWGRQFGLDEYDKAEYFGHPFKLSGLRNSTNGAKFCKRFIQEKINRNF